MGEQHATAKFQIPGALKGTGVVDGGKESVWKETAQL